MDISSLLSKELLGSKALKTMSKSSGGSADQVKQLVSAALPILMQGMANNASTGEGSASLAKALDDHSKDDASDVVSFIKNADTADGEKIVKKILGDNTATIKKGLSKSTGLNSTQVMGLLSTLAPLLLALLGNQKQETGTEGNAVGGLLTSLMGGSTSNENPLSIGNLLTTLLGSGTTQAQTTAEKKDDGFGLDDVASLLLGGSSGGSGNSGAELLGGLVGSLIGGGKDDSKKDGVDLGDIASLLLGGK